MAFSQIILEDKQPELISILVKYLSPSKKSGDQLDFMCEIFQSLYDFVDPTKVTKWSKVDNT